MKTQCYWNLRDCDGILLAGGSIYDPGAGGGNIMTEDGYIYEDSGNGVFCNMGQATPEAIKEFTGPFDGQADKEWGGGYFSM